MDFHIYCLQQLHEADINNMVKGVDGPKLLVGVRRHFLGPTVLVILV